MRVCEDDAGDDADKPGTAAVAMEALEEGRVRRQAPCAVGLSLPGMVVRATRPEVKPLAGNGRWDHLLRPGKSVELCRKLAYIFRADEPVDCGRTNGRTAGLSCTSFGKSYATEVFSPLAVVDVMHSARTFWSPKGDENLLRLAVPDDGRLVVVGDTHGQLEDVLWIFFKHGLPSAKNQYLFNGDIVDRGGHALEILLLLFALKRDNPEAVHILRGNHEDVNCVIHFGFKAELENKFQESLSPVWNACTCVVFPLMPVAALISNAPGGRRLCVVHGGVPVGLPHHAGPISLESDLVKVSRQRPTVQRTHEGDHDAQLLHHFLWADPASSEADRVRSSARAGKFVEADTKAFCAHNGLALLVRSHEVPRTLRGACFCHSGMCLTVFSASNYTGSAGNRGGVLLISHSGPTGGVDVAEHWAPPWPHLYELFGESGDLLVEPSAEIRKQKALDWEAQFGIGSGSIAEEKCSSGRSPEVPGPLGACSWSPSKAAVAEYTDMSPTAAEAAGAVASAATAQRLQFMTERLVEHKDELFERFCALDTGCHGTIPRAAWAGVMLDVLGPRCEEVVTSELVVELARSWRLEDPVEYVRFLHRFQIRDDPTDGSVLVDRIQVVSQLQAQLVDFSSLNLEHLLDPNGDKAVSRAEFASMLPHVHVTVPRWQAAALYETMSFLMQQSPLTLDSTILCLALVSQDPPPLTGDPDEEAAQQAGTQILKSGVSLPGIFRSWDTSRDGFLSLSELEQGITALTDAGIAKKVVAACQVTSHGMGHCPGRVSMFEFIRALAPRQLTLQLQRSMIKEVLKRVWICRPSLLSGLARRDPDATNVVGLEDFKSCVKEINSKLEEMGLHRLTEIQVNVVCEIAAAGSQEVRYDHFLRGLHVEDTDAPETMQAAVQRTDGADPEHFTKF